MSAAEEATMCSSKRRYDSKKDAQTVINFALKVRGRRGRALQLRSYHCPHCNGHHLTKKI